jgi:hypothetical protein
MVIVEKLVEWRLTGETEVLGENLPQRHLVHHKSHMTEHGFEPGPPLLAISFGQICPIGSELFNSPRFLYKFSTELVCFHLNIEC